MWQEQSMEQHIEQKPLIIKPPVYVLPGLDWNWCLLSELCMTIQGIARASQFEFSPTPEQLVSRFAALVRPNRNPWRESDEMRKESFVKIFRFSIDGQGFQGTDVPAEIRTNEKMNLDMLFKLHIDAPYPPGLFVPEGWAIDVLKTVYKRGIAACHQDKQLIYVKAFRGRHNGVGVFVSTLDSVID
jgi:hypothetical protein